MAASGSTRPNGTESVLRACDRSGIESAGSRSSPFGELLILPESKSAPGQPIKYRVTISSDLDGQRCSGLARKPSG